MLSMLILTRTLYYNTGLNKAGVAQQAEQLICNQQVAGSSPITSSGGEVPERPKGADCKSVVSDFGGSNPPLSTIYKDVEVGRWVRSFQVTPDSLLGGFNQSFGCSMNVAGYGWCGTGAFVSWLLREAGIAQLARASAFKAEGRGFESRFPLQ